MLSCEFSVEVDEAMVRSFAELSGDWNQLHTDPIYAKSTEFSRPIAHGALLVSFASRVLGMHIPGRESLILGMKVRFPEPAGYPATLLITGDQVHWNAATSLGRVRVQARVVETGLIVMEADVDYTIHTVKEVDEAAATHPELTADLDSVTPPRLLVTGGTGGLGKGVTARLSQAFRLTCLTRNSKSSSLEHGDADIEVDFDKIGDLEACLSNLDARQFFGVIHMAAASPSSGFASDDVESVRTQLRHAVEVPLILAKWARAEGSQVRRIVLVGSQSGNRLPQPKMGAYSIAKAAMEYLPSVLVADLASIGATVNVIALGPTDLGMNAHLSSRARAIQRSRSASFALATDSDLERLIAFLLSPDAEHLNGAVIPLDGGLLL